MIYVARVNELPIAVDESELFDYIVDEIDTKTELTVGQDVTYESIGTYVSKFMEDNEGDAFTVDEFNQILSDAATELSKN